MPLENTLFEKDVDYVNRMNQEVRKITEINMGLTSSYSPKVIKSRNSFNVLQDEYFGKDSKGEWNYNKTSISMIMFLCVFTITIIGGMN